MTKILILGGTGKTGRRIARRLQAAGLPVRTASRNAGDVRLDLDDPSTWAPALDGVTAAYLVEPAIDYRPRIPRLVAEAVDAGARRLVLLSAPGVATNDAHPLKPAEDAVRGSGVGWTVLRPTWFAQNFSESFWLQGVLSGTLALPTGDGRTAFIDADDIADVAVAALTDDRHAGETYELTGPRAISFGEAADLIAKATGRAVSHDDVDPEAFIDHQVSSGVPLEVARMLTALYVDIRDSKHAFVTDDVQRALARPPRAFEDFVTRAAASGVWD